MIRLKALNDSDDSDDEDVPTITKEALEHAAYSDYNKALQLIKNSKLEEAKEKLLLLIKNSFLSQVENTQKKDISSHPALALKYGCYKNLGSINELQGNYETCLEYYLKSTSLDPTNITIWFKIGTVSKKLKKYLLAVEAYYKGLKYSPNHWPSLENLIILLFAINDYLPCLFYIEKGLAKSKQFITGIVIKNYILEEQPSIAEDFANYYSECSPLVLEPKVDPKEAELILEQALSLQAEFSEELCSSLKENPDQIIGSPINLDNSWVSVGQALIQIYQHITKNNLRQCTRINLCSSKLNIKIDTPAVCEQPYQSEPMEVDPMNEETIADRQNGNAGTQSINQSATESDGQSGAAPSSNTDAEEEARGGKGKRRRSSLTLMELWSGKRRSARVRSGIVGRRNVEEREVDISQLEHALRELLPESLLPVEDKTKDKASKSNEDSQDTMELYKQFENQHQKDSDISKKSYFGSSLEENDIKEFINSLMGCHIFDHAEKFISSLCTKWTIPWPPKLLSLYIKIYDIFRPQGCINEVYQKTGEAAYQDTLFTILYAEGLVNLENTRQLQYSMPDLFAILPSAKVDNDRIIQLRILWFIAIALLKVKDAIQAISVLEELQNFMEPSELKYIKLPNSSKYNMISLEIVDSLLNTLKRAENLRVVACLRTEGRHQELANVLQKTFQENGANGTNSSKAANLIPSSVISTTNIDSDHLPSRPAQIIWLVDAFLQLDQYQECLIWSEAGLHEVITKLENLASSTSNGSDASNEQQNIWAKTAETLLTLIEWLLDTQGFKILDFLSSSKNLPRLVRSLVAIVCYQLDFQESPVEMPIDSIAPWTLLHKILLRENDKIKNSETNTEEDSVDLTEVPVPGHIKLLFVAHEFLAKKSWCCMKEGAFLYYIMDTLIHNIIQNGKLIHIKGKIMQDLEQVFYCLYDHPSKKNKTKYLQEHGVPALPLTLPRALQLFNLYTNSVSELPEFDSNNPGPLNAELEPLFRRIVTLIPSQEDPAQLLDKMKLFIDGSIKEMPKIPPNRKITSNLKCIYYILADYYFKNSDMDKAIQFYTLDVCIEPVRLDSWAALGLARASQLEIKLNSCEQVKDEEEFLKKADETEVCFRQALRLGPSQSTLWIELGSFTYMMHSFCSRRLKQETTSLSLEMFDILEAKKETMMDKAVDCFTKVNKVWNSIGMTVGLQDERWLHQYMLGKVAEKRDRETHSYLQYYCKAFDLLEASKATYPEVITYNNPQNLAVEALEIYYRVHASILKRLEENERTGIVASSYEVMEKALDTAKKCPFMLRSKKCEIKNPENELQNKRNINEVIEETEENHLTKRIKLNNSSSEQISNFDQDVHQIMEDLVSDVVAHANTPSSDNEKSKNYLESQVKTESVAMMVQEDNPTSSPSANLKKQPDDKKQNKDSVESEATSSNEDVEEGSSTSEADEETSSAEEDNSENEDDDSDNIDDSDNDEETSTESTSQSSSSQNISSKTANNNTNKNKPITKKQSAVPQGDEPKKDVWPLIEKCIEALEHCLSRFPQHYKSLFRLAHFYFRSSIHYNLENAQKLLLGNSYKTKNSQNIPGLFADRKNTNFFNGVWRIPVSDVDRPGSFASHMSRCVQLLMEVLTRMKDSTTLLQLYLSLRITPDADKKYLRESEREQLSQEALTFCQQAFRAKTRDQSQPSVQHLLEINKAYNRVQKHLPPKLSTAFGSLLVEAYKKRIGTENATFDQAVKFCIQERANLRAARARAAEAQAQQQIRNVTNAMPSLANVTNVTCASSISSIPLTGQLSQPTTTVASTISSTSSNLLTSNFNQLLTSSGLPQSSLSTSNYMDVTWQQASASYYSSLLSAAALQLPSPLMPQISKSSLPTSFSNTTTTSSSSLTSPSHLLHSLAAAAAAAAAVAAVGTPSTSTLSSLANPGLLGANYTNTSASSRTNSANTASRQGLSTSISKSSLINTSTSLAKNTSSSTCRTSAANSRHFPFNSHNSSLSVNPVLRSPSSASPVLPIFRGPPFVHPNLQLPRSHFSPKSKYRKVGRPPGPSSHKKSSLSITSTASNQVSVTNSPNLYPSSVTHSSSSTSLANPRKKVELTHKDTALDLSLNLPASITITPKYLNDQTPISKKDKITITEVLSKSENKNIPVIKKPEGKTTSVINKPESKIIPVIKKPENKNTPFIKKPESKTTSVINKPESKNIPVINKLENKTMQIINKSDSKNINKSESRVNKNDKSNQGNKQDAKSNSVEVITLE